MRYLWVDNMCAARGDLITPPSLAVVLAEHVWVVPCETGRTRMGLTLGHG